MSTAKGMEVTFMPLPIQIACPIPVTPDGRILDDDGEPIHMDERTERCAVWAHWMVGAQVVCDCHAQDFCQVAGIDFDGLVVEAGRKVADARVAWSERSRSTQEDAEVTEQISRGTVAARSASQGEDAL